MFKLLAQVWYIIQGLFGVYNVNYWGFATPQDAINKASTDGGGIVYFPPGTYDTAITMKDKVVCAGAGNLLTKIRYVNNDVGAGFIDNGVAVNAGFKDLTLCRAGDGTPIVGASQNNRYLLHVTSASSRINLDNVQLAEENWDLDDYAGLIAIVNESGTVETNNCKIENADGSVFKGRAVYNPSGGLGTPTSRWDGGFIHNAHKVVSLHVGTIVMKAVEVQCDMPAGASTAACLSTASGILRFSGRVKHTGLGQAIYNATDADVYVEGIIETNAFGIRNEGSGKVIVDGTLNCGELAIVNSGSGTVSVKDVTTTGTAKNLLNVTNGNTYVRGRVNVTGDIATINGANAVVELSGDMTTVTGFVLATLTLGTLRLGHGRYVVGATGIFPTGTGAKVLDICGAIIEAKGNSARRIIDFGASTNTVVTLQDARMIVHTDATECIKTDAVNAQVIKLLSAYSNKGLGADITNGITGTALIVDTDIA